MKIKPEKLAAAGRTLLLTSGVMLAAAGLLAAVFSGELLQRLLGALVFASGLIVLLLGMLVDRMGVFKQILRHVQYLTQSSEYSARLVREITEVMKAIEEGEAEERKRKAAGKPKNGQARDKEDPEIEKAVRQFDD